jgi:large subunit ribosomal protein L10
MPNKLNKESYTNLEENVKSAKSIVFADYSGLDVNQVNELRAKLDEANANARVYKNTLIRKAIKENIGVDILEQSIAGPTLMITAKDDAIAPVKALFDYINQFKLPVVKLGFLGNEILSKERVEALSKLPSKVELLSKLVGTLKNPTTRFVRTIGNPSSKFVYLSYAILQQKIEKDAKSA